MCGRITQKSPPNQLGLNIVSLVEPLNVPPRYNGSPGQEQFVIRQHPETGERIQDVETARMFIDQLEMLEAKTKGNLDKREEGILKQSLTAVRMAFVESIDQEGAPAPQPTQKEPAPPASTSAAEEPKVFAAVEPPAGLSENESRKKFSKKY